MPDRRFADLAYDTSEKGQARHTRYNRSAKGLLRSRRYARSARGRAAQRARRRYGVTLSTFERIGFVPDDVLELLNEPTAHEVS